MDLVDSSTSGVNIAGTYAKIGTPLAQPRSPTVHGATMTRIASIKVAAIRKWIRDEVPKTAEFKPAVQVLKKQLVSYEKYEGDPEMATARENVKKSIIFAVGALTIRIEHRNKARA